MERRENFFADFGITSIIILSFHVQLYGSGCQESPNVGCLVVNSPVTKMQYFGQSMDLIVWMWLMLEVNAVTVNAVRETATQ